MIIKLSQLLFKRNPRKTTPPSDCVALRYDKVTDSMKIVKPNGAETPVAAAGAAMAADLGTAAALDASEGGNGAADAGKVVKFTSSGSITCSSGILILDGSVSIKDSWSGCSLDLSPALLTDDRTWDLPDKSGTVAMTSDIPETSTGGYGATDGGKSAIFDGAGRLKAAGLVVLNAEDVESVLINSGNLVDRDYQLPDANGTLPVVPAYADLDAANTALAAGEFFWDTTLKKLRTATA